MPRRVEPFAVFVRILSSQLNDWKESIRLVHKGWASLTNEKRQVFKKYARAKTFARAVNEGVVKQCHDICRAIILDDIYGSQCVDGAPGCHCLDKISE